VRPRIDFLCLAIPIVAVACGAPGTSAPVPPARPAIPSAPALLVDADGGTPRRGPGDIDNACERIWCPLHGKNYPLDHFLTAHIGWIVHDDARGDVFVPRRRSEGTGLPYARPNVLRLCGEHVHPYFLGARGGPVTRTGWNVALGYSRAHFRAYGTRIPACCLNEEGWGFLHAAAPREYRFGDRTSSLEMAGAGWQKAVRAKGAP
jgi:hypothetical protein